MSEGEFLEDNIDRLMYYCVPRTSYDFNGIWVLSALFTKWRKDRKIKKQGQSKVEESEKIIVPPEKELETITI